MDKSIGKPKSNQGILSKENQSIAFRMSAEGHGPADIIRYFNKNNIKHQSSVAISKMLKSKCHQAEIETYRKDYYDRIKDVPIAHKRTRLDARQDILNAIKRMLKKMVDSNGDIKKRQFKAFMALTKRLDEYLTGAQDEMEKRPGTIIALSQNFGNRELTMEELRVEEQNIVGRIRELKDQGISLPNRTAQFNKEGEEGNITS